ncbi:MAG: flagellar biosynthetic protein FliQ [Deltaproteobacteria bacterium]|nr:flagellar biosynthetic protein FliQ [Deltaproteobacteria bacterium]
MFDSLLREACLLVLLLSVAPLAIASGCGLVVAILQAATQIQEQSIVYVVKFCAVSAALVLLWNWMSEELVRFLQQALYSFVSVRRW